MLPLLAISVSLRITGDVMGELYAKFERSTQKQDGSADFSGLAALHYSSSGLKALTTELTAGILLFISLDCMTEYFTIFYANN